MERTWWQGKVAYQVYPKSFYDSNNDGIGDIPGVTAKLDYLRALGVDIVWISPCYPSPFADQGYDISDYYAVNPAFGTLADMDILLAEAKKRDMYILLDLVVNHCSDEHAWFQKACADPDGEYGNFFYIEDRKPGVLPCNWRSYFGGPVWEPLPGRPDKQYMHLFHKKQPDLNWENPAVRAEVYKNIRWWMARGLAGWRIDAIINIKKALPYKDYPADRPDGLSTINAMLADATGVGEFLGEMRDEAFAPNGAFTVGEVFNEKDEELPDFIGDGGYFSSMFDFGPSVAGASSKGWYDHKPVTPEDYKTACFRSQKRVGEIGFLSNIIENHDQPRGVSRYLPPEGRTPAGKKLLAAMYFMLRGLPFIYQGQELGMENLAAGAIDEVDDINALDEYRVARAAGCTESQAMAAVNLFNRDNARTPMQWSGGENAGFSGATPWLRVNPNYTRINAADEARDPDSVLNYYKKLAALRKDPEWAETIVYGTLTPYLAERENLMAYTRQGGGKTLLVLGNFSAEAQSLPLPSPSRAVLLNNLADLAQGERGASVTLAPWQAVVLAL